MIDLDAIEARWADGTLGYADHAALGAAATGKADVDALVAELRAMATELRAARRVVKVARTVPGPAGGEHYPGLAGPLAAYDRVVGR